jgi:GNAT superfamily N-acetyltransferase
MGISITAFTTTDTEAAERAYEIELSVTAADAPDMPPPGRRRFFSQFTHPSPGNDGYWALARLDGVPVGYADIALPTLDNTENARVHIAVLPRYRRRGVGRALHEYAVRLIRDQARKRIFFMTPAADGPGGGGAGAAFALAVGATPMLADVRRRLDVAEVDNARLDRLLADAWAKADGYSLVRWRDTAPAEYLDDIAYLDSRLLEDAPMGDLEWEPEKVDAARVRATEAAIRARGGRTYHTGIRHDTTGRLVAWTMIESGSNVPWHAFQQITIVDPQHRGHRLGTIIKIENLRYALAHEPTLHVIDTFNAAGNDHMIAINEAMGYRVVDRWTNWQLNL